MNRKVLVAAIGAALSWLLFASLLWAVVSWPAVALGVGISGVAVIASLRLSRSWNRSRLSAGPG